MNPISDGSRPHARCAIAPGSSRLRQLTVAASGLAAVITATAGMGPFAFSSPAAAVEAAPDANHTWTGTAGDATGSAVSQQACDFTGDGKHDIVTSSWMWNRQQYGSIGAT